MKFTQVAGVASLLVGATLAKEIPQDVERSKRLFANGLRHEQIMSKKHAIWDRQRAAGLMTAAYPELGFTACKDGIAAAVPGDKNNTFKCNNLDLYHFLPHTALGSKTGEGSSSWGWVAPSGREFVAIAQADGAAFVEITKEGKMVYLGRLPQHHEAKPIIWRELRAYRHYILIGSEAEKHYIQVFDMRKLQSIDPQKPVVFDTKKDITSLFRDLPIGRTHNVVVDEKNKYAVSVGAAPRSDKCKAGLIFIDLTDIKNPTSPGCASQDGYVHDAQCLPYKGPDTRYKGRNICYGYNEDTLTIYDVTDRTNATIISRTSYEGASYTHQGWVLDKSWQDYLIMDDEYDEYDGAGLAADGRPVTYIWDIKDLKNPKQTGHYKANHKGIDHNQYIVDGYVYQSNYGSGLHVLDITSIPKDPSGAGVHEVAFFDIYPEDDDKPDGGVLEFVGSWSSYAMLPSGFILINTIERGAFIVKLQTKSTKARGTRLGW
ncbi:hypothetical protein H072_2760 [Dactylellina haptotyla CBS 200.50]|uniref:Regulatory P domain-containing protein n=1 Tax=Dactylellina haptotyla (strain CBS 200.50) TaxID=1284197 RepID=S8AJY3_DACHA|nr:hypothetical protein H072_2760 [Dactylellina haptotyla CBS 200.50]